MVSFTRGLRVLIGIMLAAMFSATMSSISGTLNLHASIISRD